ncbi:oxidoreductase [Mycolicibacterium sp. P1-18]|uniref:PDR/VanB family oxidoreductase n=1 Tax=Mycolicibacterium sp. P1-18 TaxID=2024615 RepID=UPI0011F248B0|nr:PDR/VanB family oxidoreductase [Mycolicibacterium sp. P1-18]KAA0094600.1 oxidoreductase [Mycolicibacterium sp. P1-18]
MTDLELVVVAVDDRIPGIRNLTLARPDGRPLPSFTPGSHLVVECGPVLNAYSLTGDGTAPASYSISVLLCSNGSGGSRWLHDDVRTGDLIAARGPRSAFPPVLSATRHLLVAAGIGITPMVSHLRSARRWGREVQLLYVHRRGRGAHLEDVEALTDRASTFTDRESFTAATEHALASQPFGTHLYVCGPASFIADVTARATDWGWPASRVHVEHFGVDAFDPGEPFEVHLRTSGDTFTVASGVSLLAALLARGVDVPNLCRQGVCGECRIDVAAGEIRHRDLYLSEGERAAGDSMMCCVSRSAGPRLELAL